MAPRPIFLHGVGGGTGIWDHQEPRFEGAVVLALPGHPAGEPSESVAGYADWVAGALEGIDAPRVLVGHSLGGAIALQVALERPDIVEGLVLVSTGPRLFVPDEAFDGARRDLAGECERILRKGWRDPTDEAIAREVERMVAAGSVTLLCDYAACRDFDLTGRLGDVRAPALVVVGSDDRLTTTSLADELARGLPQAIMAVVPDVGHFVMKEAPATLDLLVAAYLARLELSLDA